MFIYNQNHSFKKNYSSFGKPARLVFDLPEGDIQPSYTIPKKTPKPIEMTLEKANAIDPKTAEIRKATKKVIETGVVLP